MTTRRCARLAPLAIAFIALTMLAGCGFRPLYGGSGANSAVPELAAVKVQPIRDRIGQQLRNHLVERLAAAQAPATPRYSLHVDLSESTQKLAVQRNELATRANYQLVAKFVLSAGTAELFRSSRTVISSYNILVSDFATLAAAENAKVRALREVADAIRTSLAIYFSQRRARAGPVVR